MTQMSEDTLSNELTKMSDDATGNNSTFMTENEYLLDRYMGNPYGDEVPERSKVISNDVMDVIEADMPSLVRVFLGPSEIVKFTPRTANEEDTAEADSKTKYVNWQVREQPWSFSVLHGFIKNALIEKTSVVKYFIEESISVEEHKKTGLSDEELAVFQDSLEGEDVKSIKIVREEQQDKGENSVVIKVEKERKQVKIAGVELEDFRMTKNATSKDTAELVGDVSLMTRSALIAMGFKRELVAKLQLATDQNDGSRLQEIRDADEGGADDDTKSDSWANEQVKVEDLYPLIDFDGDGIAERRHVMRSGDTILLNEVFNHVPYAVMSSILMPHKAVGLSRAEITAPTARVKTAILRGINDNIYAVNNPRIAANKNVNMDDLLVMRPNGIVRTVDETNPGQNMFAVEIPYIGDRALQVLQYWDQARSQTTGTLMASQGLDADNLGKETATRFEGIEQAAEAKIELIARVMAETGFRQLYEGVAWLDSNFQNSETEIQVLGTELAVNPSDWKYEQHTVSKVGLGIGDDENKLRAMSALWVLHQQLRETNSPMTDEVKRFNVLKTMINSSGLADVSEFFNDPEKPEELTSAQNEIMTGIIQQLQEQLQAMQNPLAEAETIKANASLVKAQSDAQIKVAQMAEDQRQFNIETAQNQDQFTKEILLKISTLQDVFEQNLKGNVSA